MLEEYYHVADPFRWYINVFLKSLKEIPQLVQMELQNETGFKEWYKPVRVKLKNDPLMKALSKKRDIIVHKKMFLPHSHAELGITEGKDMKLGLTLPVHPLEDSAHAMDRYLKQASEHRDFLGVLIPDDDSIPCVYRRWHLEGFDEEIVNLCAEAWLRLSQVLASVLRWLGEEDVPELTLNCRHASRSVHYKLFDRQSLIEKMEKFESKEELKA